jgi:hypothetical protein
MGSKTAIWVYRGYEFTQNVSRVGENEASNEYVVSVFKEESKNEPVPPSHHMNFKTILALSSHLRLIRATGLFVSSFPAKSLYNALLFSRTLHAKPI